MPVLVLSILSFSPYESDFLCRRLARLAQDRLAEQDIRAVPPNWKPQEDMRSSLQIRTGSCAVLLRKTLWLLPELFPLPGDIVDVVTSYCVACSFSSTDLGSSTSISTHWCVDLLLAPFLVPAFCRTLARAVMDKAGPLAGVKGACVGDNGLWTPFDVRVLVAGQEGEPCPPVVGGVALLPLMTAYATHGESAPKITNRKLGCTPASPWYSKILRALR